MSVRKIFRWLDKILHSPVEIPKLSLFQKRLIQSRKAVRSLKAKAEAARTPSERFADWMTSTFGTITFLLINVAWFAAWIVVNTNLIEGVEPFDPFPFSLLTTIVSLEAIILAIFVLISQNREQKVNDLREEVDLQIDLIAENELTKAMHLLAKIAKKQGIDLSKDEELQEMLKPLDTDKLEKSLAREIGGDNSK